MFDDPAPWEMLPDMDPGLPEHHGIGEFVIVNEWLRSWRVLGEGERAAYLERRPPPADWRAALEQEFPEWPVDVPAEPMPARRGWRRWLSW